MKKKILHIVESFGSGVFSFLVDLINGTSDEFDITIAYGLRLETPENFEDYFGNKVKFIEVKNFTRNIKLDKDLKALFEVKKIIKEVSPDVIHLHSSKAGVIGRFAGNGKKTKIMYNPHGFSFLMKNSSKFKRNLYWTIERITALRKATIVGCSEGEYKEALKLSKNSICINNGINIKKLEKETEDLEKNAVDFSNLKICTSGRIGDQKNPELFNEIANNFPNFKFMWIGDGELRNKLTSPNIEITGWKTREEALKLVNNSDIFILTSLWEGMPLSLLEAMYLNKLCIVTDCIGNNDVINNGENGFIIKNNNYKEIIENLNEENYKRNIVKAREDVIEKYNITREINEYRRLYNE